MTQPGIRSNREGGSTWLASSWRATRQMLALWTGGHPLSWLLLGLEGIVLMGGAIGPLLIVHLWKNETGALSLQVSRGVYEFWVLALMVLFWCGWCEGGYRLGRHLGGFKTVAWQRRLTLELWTGVLSSLLLSVLTSLNPLLPLVVVFLLFGGIESLRESGLGVGLGASARRGFRRSFHTVSLDPLRFLSLMAVPGVLLYLYNLLLRILQICYRDLVLPSPTSASTPGIVDARVVSLAILIVLLALVGLGLFFIARIDLALNYLRKRQRLHREPSPSLEPILGCVRRASRYVVGFSIIVACLFGLYQLVNAGLFTRNYFYMALEACVGYVIGFVQSLLDLLAKFSFILIVFALIVGLCITLISLAKGNGNDLLNRSLVAVKNKIQDVSAFISKQINLPGQAIQITTLLSAVGLIATQTYSKILEAQGLRLEQEREQQQQLKLQQQQKQDYGNRAENEILRFQQNLQDLAGPNQDGMHWRDLDRRNRVASISRDLTRQLKDPDGNPDGPRRARVLQHLYDSRFLIAGEKTGCRDDALSRVIAESKRNKEINKQIKEANNYESPRTLGTLTQFELDRRLIDQSASNASCGLARLVPLNMDFSRASLKGAFLNNANLPFIDLSYADLRFAQLRGADLRFANLTNANLKGANLTGAKLDFADLANTELRDTRLETANATFAGAVLFYATHDRTFNLPEESLSWDLTLTKTEKADDQRKGPFWCPLDPRMDPETNQPHSSDKAKTSKVPEIIAQAGAKCSNRIYSGFKRRSDQIQNRNWANGDFTNTTIENFRLNGIDFTNANLKGATFRNVRLNTILFTGANLEGVRFENSVLDNVDFTGANVRRMAFVGSSAERLTFRGSDYVLPIELGDYAKDLLLLSGRNADLSTAKNQSPPARLAQRLLLPLLLAPFPLRPSRVLIWLVPYSPELVFASEDRQSIP